MTFRKFVLQVIFPVSFVLSLVLVPVGLMINPQLAVIPSSLILDGNESLIHELPQSTFEEPDVFFQKFYSVSADNKSYSERTFTVYVVSIIFYFVPGFLILLLGYYIYYRLKKVKAK
ncbi:hypothetical protein FBQ84_00620 [Ignavibacteria bacterium CHB1]|nr:MAG: hypothetical protein EDM69_01095 [Chlorobiota bacterium]MBV6398735.1 hypothetical protein [Ignavibacteria bacterium]MCC6885096.1 hypothetical protein [Ignavibacteriales bacterium]MCE7952114.1 hypothetical protein [Chlorobi bacterium CHB7]MDL1886329.1 hypothetical protein [Ignavibacteria bacterium CHB1]RIK49483.1 MAG: hypothetical protein DCC60_04080 [Ignavibacteriota bacterium]